MIVTFYSFKGGVGRTMTMVNVAEVLAAWGYRVVVCDWDLEAPGLERYLVPPVLRFQDEPARKRYDRQLEQMLRQPGLLDLLTEYKKNIAVPPEEPPEEEGFIQVGKVWLRKPSSRAYVPPERSSDTLRLLSAGRREGVQFQSYAEGVRKFDWTEFYEKWAGSAYLEFFRRDLSGDPSSGIDGAADIVLIDSRTGVTEQGGVATHHLADLVVLMTAPNEANIAGTKWMADSLSQRTLHAKRGNRSIDVLPVEARVEVFSEKELFVDFDSYFRSELAKYLPAAIPEGAKFFGNSRIPYVSFYAYQERIVAREERAKQHPELLRACEHLAYAVVRCGLAASLIGEDLSPPELRTAVPSASGARDTRRLRGLVFISSAPDVRAAADAIAAALSKRGALVTSSPGDIGNAIAAVFVTGAGPVPPWMETEIEIVLRVAGSRAVIVPVLLAPRSLPPPLAEFPSLLLPAELTPEAPQFDELVGMIVTGRAANAKMPDAVPWPGWRSYGESDARFFFGRESEIRTLVRDLALASKTSRWLRVEGANGVGTSSIVRAGLIPAVRLGEVAGIPRDATVAVASAAGATPVQNLVAALDLVCDSTAVPADPLEFISALQLPAALLLVVDGLEQLANVDEQTRSRFDAMIETLMKDERVVLVTTSRSGFLVPSSMRWLHATGLRVPATLIPPMTGEQVRSVVTGPAAVAGVTYEPGLVDRIVADTPDPLTMPALLSVTLNRLWTRRDGTLLTHAAYDAAGGFSGMVRHAAQAFLEKTPDLPIVRDLILRLVFVPPARRVRSLVSLLTSSEHSPSERLRVLNELAAAFIVRIDGDDVILAHDAILDVPLVRHWTSEELTMLRRRSELELAAERWSSSGKPNDALPRGGYRKQLEAFRGFNPAVTEYLDAARRETIRWTGWGVLAVVVAFALAFAIMGLFPSDDPAPPSVAAKDLASVSLQFAEYDTAKALTYAVRAWEADAAEPLVLRALQKSIEESVRPVEITLDQEIVSRHVALNASVVAVASPQRIIVWDLDRRMKIGDFVPTPALRVTDVMLSGDGKRLLVVHDRGQAEVWSLPERKPIWRARWAARVGLISPDGDRVVVLAPDAIRSWSISKNGRTWSLPASRISTIDFSPDGKEVVAAAVDGSLQIISADFGVRLTEVVGEREVVHALAFTVDGSLVAAATPSRVTVRELTGEGAWRIAAQEGRRITSVALVGEPRQLVIGDERGSIRFFGIPPASRPTASWAVVPGAITALSVDRAATRCIWAGATGEVEVWSLDRQIRADPGLSSDVPATWAAFTPDGRWALVTRGSTLLAVEEAEVRRYRYIPESELGPRAQQRLMALRQ